MKIQTFLLIFFSIIVHSDIGAQEVIGTVGQKEKYIVLSKEKIQLEMETRKLRELLKVSEERIKELMNEKLTSENDLKACEKELSAIDKKNENLSEQISQARDTIDKIGHLITSEKLSYKKDSK
jgi:hypothetical protein